MNTPEKPKNMKDQISMLWDAVFNDLPHKLDKISWKQNLQWALLLLILAGIVAALFRG